MFTTPKPMGVVPRDDVHERIEVAYAMNRNVNDTAMVCKSFRLFISCFVIQVDSISLNRPGVSASSNRPLHLQRPEIR